ncbi:MAG: peptidoglycan-binding domain-containing protein [Candidatus Paceibacterota bacterium]|jgi:hypothetical protein
MIGNTSITSYNYGMTQRHHYACIGILSCITFFLLFENTHAAIIRTLSVGSSGIDVFELQKILNRDFDTLVAQIGPGSPGKETSYFGNATRAAVLKFQQKYSQEILIPAGLSGATGIVGPLTLKQLKSIDVGQEILSNRPPSNITPIASPNVSIQKKSLLPVNFPPQTTENIEDNQQLRITSFSDTIFQPGDILEIRGKKFKEPLSVFIDDTEYKNPQITDENSIKVRIPSIEGIALVWIRTPLLETRMFSPIFIMITDSSGAKQYAQILESLKIQNEKMLSF